MSCLLLEIYFRVGSSSLPPCQLTKVIQCLFWVTALEANSEVLKIEVDTERLLH